MMIRVLLLATACALAACSPPAPQSSDVKGNAPPAASAPEVGGNVSIQPGQYRTTVTILSITMPGLPPGAAERMKAHPHVTEDCVTSNDVNEMMRHSLVDEDEGRTCSENHITTANGHMDGTATCRNEDGSTNAMQISGSYGSSHVEMNMTMSGQLPSGPMSQQIHMVSDRIGACAAGTEKKP